MIKYCFVLLFILTGCMFQDLYDQGTSNPKPIKKKFDFPGIADFIWMQSKRINADGSKSIANSIIAINQSNQQLDSCLVFVRSYDKQRSLEQLEYASLIRFNESIPQLQSDTILFELFTTFSVSSSEIFLIKAATVKESPLSGVFEGMVLGFEKGEISMQVKTQAVIDFQGELNLITEEFENLKISGLMMEDGYTCVTYTMGDTNQKSVMIPIGLDTDTLNLGFSLPNIEVGVDSVFIRLARQNF